MKKCITLLLVVVLCLAGCVKNEAATPTPELPQKVWVRLKVVGKNKDTVTSQTILLRR